MIRSRDKSPRKLTSIGLGVRYSLVLSVCMAALTIADDAAAPASDNKSADRPPNPLAEAPPNPLLVADPHVGTFEGAGLAITIEASAQGYSGQIRRGGQPFDFKATFVSNTLSGAFSYAGFDYQFTAKLKDDVLTLTTDGKAFQLTRRKDADPNVAPKPPVTVPKPNPPTTLIPTPAPTPTPTPTPVPTPVPNVPVRPTKSMMDLRAPVAESKQVVVRESSLGTLPESVVAPTLTISRDGRRIAFVMNEDGRRRVVVDGARSEAYDAVTTPMFSADGSRVGFMATDVRKQLVVIDGMPGKLYDGVGHLTFSDDGRRAAFAARRGDVNYIVTDGVEGPPFDKASVGILIYSADGTRLAHVVDDGDKGWVMVNGVAGEPYDDGHSLVFSTDSRHFGYFVRRGNQWQAVIDDKSEGDYQRVRDLVFSIEGKRSAYVAAAHTGGEFVVLSGKPGPTYLAVQHNSLTFSPDGERFAYVGVRLNKAHVVLDGVESEPFDDIIPGSLTFSPDSSRLGFYARQQGQWRLVLPQEMSDRFEEIRPSPVVFSRNSRHWAFVAVRRDLKAIVVTDDRAAGPYDDVAADSLTYAPDGKHLAYHAKVDGKWHVIIDGARPLMSAPYDRFLPGGGIRAAAPAMFHTLAQRGDEMLRLEVQPAP